MNNYELTLIILLLVSCYSFGITLWMLLAEPKIKYLYHNKVSIGFMLNDEYILWNGERFIYTGKINKFGMLNIWHRGLTEDETKSVLDINKEYILPK